MQRLKREQHFLQHINIFFFLIDNYILRLNCIKIDSMYLGHELSKSKYNIKY